MKRIVFLVVTLSLLGACQSVTRKRSNIDLADALIGTNSNTAFSHGNTYPAIARPWGMNVWTAQTGLMNDNWVYTWQSDSIRGFRQTHTPSPWIGDYGFFSLMPTCGVLSMDDRERASSFYHEEETATPYYYSVRLADYDITSEITATERCGFLRFTYGGEGKRYLLLDGYRGGGSVKILPESQMIVGYVSNSSGGTPKNFKNHYVLRFDRPFASYGIWDGNGVRIGDIDFAGDRTGAYVEFESDCPRVCVTVSSSYISEEQAMSTLLAEIGDRDFDAVRAESKSVWEEQFGRIEVSGGTESQRRTFYSNLYRVSLYPRSFHEFREDGTPYHYSPFDGEVHDGYMFTDNGFWDTFRSAHPFYTLVYPELTEKLMSALVNVYEEGGWLPNWFSPGYRSAMIGAHAVSLVSDAYGKGIRSFDTDKIMEALIKETSFEDHRGICGRRACGEYNEKGYVPYPDYPEAVSMTLEYAYDDFCGMLFAERVGMEDLAADFKARAMNYRNVFDEGTGFMRPKRGDGQWYAPFDPYKWGGPYTEGNAVQYSWSVFHDIKGLETLLGGKDAFVAKLDSVFTRPPKFSYYDRGFNEVAEMHRAGFGQYAHGNQPAQHLPYLYAYVGEPWKTQYWTRKVMDCLYDSTQDGYPGDEDNGQTSSWYLFSAMGFYPVCPGTGEYVLGSPLFERVDINLRDGKVFTVEAKGNSYDKRFVSSCELNGKKYGKTYVTHDDIVRGGVLKMTMSERPARNVVYADEDLPYSLSR